MTDLLQAILLGVVQGLTEFLPVSSTGHLVLTESLLGVSHDEFGLSFDASMHLGTLAAVLLYFRMTALSLMGAWLRSLRDRKWDVTTESRLAWLIVLATIPAGLIGAALESTAENAFRSPAVVAVMLLAFSVPMLLAERVGRGDRELDHARPADALLLGLAQSIALIPGVSRSGITISAAMFGGFKREQAAVFTFLMSAPIIAAAGGKQMVDAARGGNSTAADGWLYAAGLLSEAVVGYAAIAFLVRYLSFNSLNVFVAYRVALGLAVWLS